MRIIFSTLLCSAVLCSASSAWACGPDDEEDLILYPAPLDEEITLSVNGYLYFVDPWGDGMPPMVDPEGVAVEWEFEADPLLSRMDRVQPVGGWLVGDYVYGEDEDYYGLYAPVGEVAYTVEDRVDEEPPTVSIQHWAGVSAAPPPPSLPVHFLCGGFMQGPPMGAFDLGSAPMMAVMTAATGAHPNTFTGVEYRLSGAGEPVVYRVSVSGDGVVDREDVRVPQYDFWGTGRVSLEPGQRAQLRVEAFDLAGNTAEDRIEEVIATSGCHSSVAGSGVTTPILTMVLALLGLVRRRLYAQG